MSQLTPRLLGYPAGPTPSELAGATRGRLVVITGTSRGIGRATAIRLLAVGAHVVGVARTSAAHLELERATAHLPGTFDHLEVDLRDTEAAQQCAQAIVAQHGSPDLLICNAGHSIHRYLVDYLDRFHDIGRTAAVNYLGTIAFALPILDAMLTQRRGHLIAVSTTAVGFPLPGWSAYTASKTAFSAWLDAVAPELAQHQISTTNLQLPRVATQMSAPSAGRYPVPELSPAQAAGIICAAICSRASYLIPGWTRAAAAIRVIAPTLTQAALRIALRFGVRP